MDDRVTGFLRPRRLENGSTCPSTPRLRISTIHSSSVPYSREQSMDSPLLPRMTPLRMTYCHRQRPSRIRLSQWSIQNRKERFVVRTALPCILTRNLIFPGEEGHWLTETVWWE